jgi:CDP-glycerol glycerophosphotransferase (TagB/SpsB family)
MAANGFNRRLVWLVKNQQVASSLLQTGVPAAPLKSVAGLWLLLRADTIVTTTGSFGSLRVARQRLVNLWHGMPLKTIESFLPYRMHAKYSNKNRITSPRDLVVSTSPLTQALLSAAFELPPRQVPITGQPRTDRMFRESERVSGWLATRTGASANEKKYVFMLPTYREGKYSEGNNSDVLNDLDGWNAINMVLESAGAHMLVKFHRAERGRRELLQEYSRIHLLSDEELARSQIDLYDILATTDVLVTDYSSVYIDFLLLDRPMIFLVPDLAEYQADRGFMFEPYEFWTPGPKATTMPELATELQCALNGEDTFQIRRRELLSVFHTYPDGNAASRIASLLESD